MSTGQIKSTEHVILLPCSLEISGLYQNFEVSWTNFTFSGLLAMKSANQNNIRLYVTVNSVVCAHLKTHAQLTWTWRGSGGWGVVTGVGRADGTPAEWETQHGLWSIRPASLQGQKWRLSHIQTQSLQTLHGLQQTALQTPHVQSGGQAARGSARGTVGVRGWQGERRWGLRCVVTQWGAGSTL